MGEHVQMKQCQAGDFTDFTEKEKDRIAKLLRQPLKADLLKKRPAFRGNSVHYIDGATSYSLANDIFGFDGWKSQIINTEIDFAKEEQRNSDRWFIGVSAIVRVELKNGAYHEDIGFGEAVKVKGRGAALQKAKKEAVTDATKRALRVFGNGLGNCLRLKWYQDALKKKNSFSDLQEEEYIHCDLLDPKTGGLELKKPEQTRPLEEKGGPFNENPFEEKLSSNCVRRTVLLEKKQLNSSAEKQSVPNSIEQRLIFRRKPALKEGHFGNNLKRNRNEKESSRKFRKI